MRLKSEITSFMMHLDKDSKSSATSPIVPMPNVKPKNFTPVSANLPMKNQAKARTTDAA